MEGHGPSYLRRDDFKWSPGGSLDQWSHDSNHFDEEQDPDPYVFVLLYSETADSDPVAHSSEKLGPDPD